MPQKILIIEDDVDLAKILTKRLLAAGYDVASAPDAISGVKLAHDKPDLIMLDLMLPGGGGLLVLERIKLSVHTNRIPVIIMTAMENADNKQKVLASGVEAFIQKPYDAQAVMAEVKRILGGSAGDTQGKKKILIVDDDQDILKLIKVRLLSNGFLVMTAEDGAEALKQVELDPPDLIVADLMMPDLNGWRLSQILKSDARYKKIPIILLSAILEREGPAADIEVGDYYLPKPFDGEKLIGKIKELLSKFSI